MPAEHETARVRRVIRVILHYFPRGNYMSNFRFAYTALVHALDRMDSKDHPIRSHVSNLASALAIATSFRKFRSQWHWSILQ